MRRIGAELTTRSVESSLESPILLYNSILVRLCVVLFWEERVDSRLVLTVVLEFVITVTVIFTRILSLRLGEKQEVVLVGWLSLFYLQLVLGLRISLIGSASNSQKSIRIQRTFIARAAQIWNVDTTLHLVKFVSTSNCIDSTTTNRVHLTAFESRVELCGGDRCLLANLTQQILSLVLCLLYYFLSFFFGQTVNVFIDFTRVEVTLRGIRTTSLVGRVLFWDISLLNFNNLKRLF